MSYHVNYTFDDDAPTSIPTSASGTYRPSSNNKNLKFPKVSLSRVNNTLSAFNGLSPNGTWGLYVFDDASSDSGRVDGGWKLSMRVDPRTSPTATR